MTGPYYSKYNYLLFIRKSSDGLASFYSPAELIK